METVRPRYLVLELRQNADNTMSNQVTSFDPDNRKGAVNKYYVQCAAAAVSDKPIYSVLLMTTEGFVIEQEVFKNEVQQS